MSLTRYVTHVRVSDAANEEPAVTRERLRDRYPRGATRRMTQLGLLLGDALLDMEPGPEDAIIYASRYAETRALEAFLDSFPTASPTLFQTSIHPSAVQQLMIGRQQPIREFLPLTGNLHLVAQAFTAAFLSPARRVIVCGGEERGTWLLEQRLASDSSFALAFALCSEPKDALAQVTMDDDDAANVAPLSLPDLLARLVRRENFTLSTPACRQITWTWA